MNTKNHIAVVGAGFAGLAAANELFNSGFTVTVLEARQRVGGRVWSKRLPNGAIVELGGEWISSADPIVLEMVRCHDLDLVEVGVNFRIRTIVNGPAVSVEDQRKTHQIAAATLAEMDEATISKSTVSDFLSNLPLQQFQRELLRCRLQCSYGKDLHQIALRMLGDYSLGDSGKFYRIATGNQSLAKALAGQLPDVRLGHEVSTITHHPDGVSIRGEAARGTFEIGAQAVILALPVLPLGELAFDPDLPRATTNAIMATPMGAAAKMAIGTRKAPFLRALQDVEMPYWCWTGNGKGDVPRSALTAFCGSKQAQRNLATNSYDPSTWLNKLRSANPDLDFVGDPILVDWSQDEWARGCYSAFDNKATDLIPLLSLPVGRLFFAGEHTAIESGTMEGALASGLRAAGQISEVL
jgi:monoamine oxidase